MLNAEKRKLKSNDYMEDARKDYPNLSEDFVRIIAIDRYLCSNVVIPPQAIPDIKYRRELVAKLHKMYGPK